MLVYGFYPNNYTDPSTYQPDWNILTHLAYCAYQAELNGVLNPLIDIDKYYTVRNQAHQHGIKVIICVASSVQDVIDDLLTTSRAPFINNVLSLIQTNAADGVNFDFEVPRDINTITGTSNAIVFEEFIRNVNSVLKAANPNYHISFCAGFPLAVWSSNPNIQEYIDSIILMEYDFRGIYIENYSGATSPYNDPNNYDFINSITDFLKYYPKNKMIAALPFYGIDYTTVSEIKGSVAIPPGSSIPIKEAISSAVTYGRNWDDATNTPWYSYYDGANHHQVWYDDYESLSVKCAYARALGLSGVGMWALGYEGNDLNIWNSLVNDTGTRLFDNCMKTQDGDIMPRIKNNGLTQYVRFRAIRNDYSAFTGTVEGDALPGAIVIFSHNTPLGWIDSVIESPSVLWSSGVGVWEAAVPPSTITQNGDAELYISGTDMVSVSIPLEVGNAGGSGGMGHIITEYDFDASERKITITESGYTTLKLEQVLEIRNITKGKTIIYDSKIREPSITILGEVISWEHNYSYEGNQFEDTDTLQIVVNTN